MWKLIRHLLRGDKVQSALKQTSGNMVSLLQYLWSELQHSCHLLDKMYNIKQITLNKFQSISSWTDFHRLPFPKLDLLYHTFVSRMHTASLFFKMNKDQCENYYFDHKFTAFNSDILNVKLDLQVAEYSLRKLRYKD